jgi:hypothetical protein
MNFLMYIITLFGVEGHKNAMHNTINRFYHVLIMRTNKKYEIVTITTQPFTKVVFIR